MPDRTQDLKNHRQVAVACKNYTDTEIKKSEERILSIVARNNVDFIDHTDEPTYRFTAPANAKLLMLQSIAGNSNKIAPPTPSDDSVARLKVIPENTYKSQVDYIGGKTVKYNQLVALANNTQSFTNNTDTTATIQTNISFNANDKLLVLWYQNNTLTSNTRNTMQYTTISDGVSTFQSTASNYNLTSGLKSWFIQPSGPFNLKYWANTLGNDLTISNIVVINLTQDFGAGNEPSTVETAIPLLKANGYKLDGTDEYSTGSLKHAITTSVDFLPTNLFDYDTYINTTPYYEVSYTVRNYQLKPNTTYSVFLKELKNNATVGVYLLQPDSSQPINTTGFIGLTSNYMSQPKTFTTDSTGVVKIGYVTGDGTYLQNNLILNLGSTALPYIPYVAPITKAIPSEVLALELNKSAGSVYDVIDCNNKAGTRKIQTYTFTGNETWYIENGYAYSGILNPNGKLNTSVTITNSIITSAKVNQTYKNTLLIYLDTTVYNTSAKINDITRGNLIEYELDEYVPYDLSQYFTDGWNKVDLDKQYATCEMVVADPIDMPNKVEYYGTIIHSLATAVKQEGFNVWDGTWDNGYINDTTGANAGDGITSYLRSKNYIGVLPSQVIYFKLPSNGKVYYYDINQNYISYADLSNGNSKTIPTNCYFIRFWINYSGTYKHDICINISNQDLNGTYKPYKAPITRLLPNSEAKYSRGIADGVRNTRVFCDDEGNAVNEGSLDVGLSKPKDSTWNYTEGSQYYGNFFYAIVPSDLIKYEGSVFTTTYSILSNNYVTTNMNNFNGTDKTIALDGNTSQIVQIRIKDSVYNDGTIFKNHFTNDDDLYYHKATTDSEPLDDFDYFFDCEEGDTFTIIGCELLQCYATYSFLIKEAKSNE